MKLTNHGGYGGRLEYGSGTVELFSAERSDIPELAEMYGEIAITKENYVNKFNFSSPDGFGKTGGMFVVHTEKTLEAVFDEGKSFIAAARHNGRILAAFWCSEYDPHFSGYIPPNKLDGIDGTYLQRLREALEDDRIYFLRELIVREENSFSKLSLMMFYTIIEYLGSCGATHSLGEIYRLCGYYDEGGFHPLDMLNAKSYSMTMQTGCRFLGENSRIHVEADGYTAVIVPRMLCFDYSETQPALKRQAEQAGIIPSLG